MAGAPVVEILLFLNSNGDIEVLRRRCREAEVNVLKKPRVFLCHSSADKPFVRSLQRKFKQDGIESWFDEVEIKVGESIHQRINEGLKSSDFFAVVLSEASVKSKWVQEELSSASALEKLDARGVFVLPILLEECDVPPLLLDRRYANFKDDPESAYQELVDAIFFNFEKRHPTHRLHPLLPLDISATLIQELAKRPKLLQSLPPRVFENLVAATFADLGYEVQLTSPMTDGGRDVILSRALPGIGREQVLVECKRYSRPIGVSDVRQLLGYMASEKPVNRAVLVTSSHFTRSARELAEKAPHDVTLIDADRLSEWLRLVAKKGPTNGDRGDGGTEGQT